MRSTRRLTTALVSLALVSTPSFAEEAASRKVNNGNVVLDGVPEIPARITAQLSRYQSVRGAGFQDWSQDGQSLYVSTRLGDTSQLHYIAFPGGARQQITFFDKFGVRNMTASAGVLVMSVGGSIRVYDPRTKKFQRKRIRPLTEYRTYR